MVGHDQLKCLGNRVRQYRKAKSFSMKNLAEECSLSTNTISLIERGRVSPTAMTLIKISEVLEIPASILFSDCGPSRAYAIRSSKLGVLQHLDQFAHFATNNEPHDTDSGEISRQMGLCINGQVEFKAHDQSINLRPGDCLCFCEEAYHRWINTNNHAGVIILVIPANSPQTKIVEVLNVPNN